MSCGGVCRWEPNDPAMDHRQLFKEPLMKTILVMLTVMPAAFGQTKVPKIWDDKALAEWATPVAALGIRPGHFSSAEYYAIPADNFKTYPVYRPDREPPGYWEWLQRQKPEPLVVSAQLRHREDWIRAG